MHLRLTPWFTDSSIKFLNNFFKWYPQIVQERISVLEWGGGNSTLYFLQKNCQVFTIESNDSFIEDLCAISRKCGKKSCVVKDISNLDQKFNEYDLIILRANYYQDISDSIFSVMNWSIIVNDGISRKEVLEAIYQKSSHSIIILDNTEYCANWGRLARSSGKTETVKSYRKILRDTSWTKYLFEQPEGRDGHCTADNTGWESPNRWITSILWKEDHILSQLMISNLGFPLVNIEGIANTDLDSLAERCPFDWNTMEWELPEYPLSLNLGLNRKFD